MKFTFNPNTSRIIVSADVVGRTEVATVKLLLDTGASHSILSEAVLVELDYDPRNEGEPTTLTTGSAPAPALRLVIEGLAAMGRYRTNFSVVCYDLPPDAGVDGVIGLDFLRDHVLTLDFVNGILTFE
jgi:aspartyl protease family protein